MQLKVGKEGNCYVTWLSAGGPLCIVCDWTKRDVWKRASSFVRKLSVIGLLKRWMGVFLRAYYRRGEGVGQLKNCAYYIIESELRAGDSLKFVTRGVWLWETNEDWLDRVLEIRRCMERGRLETKRRHLVRWTVRSSLEFWVLRAKRDKILLWEKAASAR